MPKPLPDPARRKLLSRTSTATAAGLAVAVLGPASAGVSGAVDAVAQQKPDREQPRGYQETDRVRRYYQLARF
jgi:hypothetical protein